MTIFFNLLAIFTIAFAITNLVVSIGVSLLGQKLTSVQLKPRKALLWFCVSMPWIMSILVCLYLLDIYVYSSIFETKQYAHWHHISDFNWFSWHAVTIILLLSYMMFVLTSKTRQLWLHRQEVSLLTCLSKNLSRGAYEVEIPKFAAFTSGIRSKKCFITTGLLNEVTPEELDVILKHERAHVVNNDPLKKWLFSILVSFYFAPVARLLTLQMVLAMEQDADNAVLEEGIDRIFVASTLIKVAKLNAQEDILKSSALVVNFGADVLEQRIYFLLGRLQLSPINKTVAFSFAIALFFLCMTSLDGVHHLIETVFSH